MVDCVLWSVRNGQVYRKCEQVNQLQAAIEVAYKRIQDLEAELKAQSRYNQRKPERAEF